MTQQKLYQSLACRAVIGYVTLIVSIVFFAGESLLIGSIFAAGTIITFSYAVMYDYRKSYEGPNAPPLFDHKLCSWAFMYGDTVVVPIGAVFAVHGMQSPDVAAWKSSILWIVFSFAVGLFIGWCFHQLDGKNYEEDGNEVMLKSPTKLAHDFVAYPVIFGGAVFVTVPMLLHYSEYTKGVLISLAVWLFLGGCDIYRKLKRKNLHVGWDPEEFRPL